MHSPLKWICTKYVFPLCCFSEISVVNSSSFAFICTSEILWDYTVLAKSHICLFKMLQRPNLVFWQKLYLIWLFCRQANWGDWNLPDSVCDFYLAMDVVCSTSSIFNLVAISCDRFVMVYIFETLKCMLWTGFLRWPPPSSTPSTATTTPLPMSLFSCAGQHLLQ